MVSKSFSLNIFKEALGTDKQHRRNGNLTTNALRAARSSDDTSKSQSKSSTISRCDESMGKSNVAKLSPALKRTLLSDLRPSMRRKGSSRSLKSLASDDSSRSAQQGRRGLVEADGVSPLRAMTTNRDHPLNHKESNQSLKELSDRKFAPFLTRDGSSRSMKSATSQNSVHSFQQVCLDEGDGAPQLRGLLLARKAELSMSLSQPSTKIPLQTLANDSDNDDVSVLSEGDSSIAESLTDSPVKRCKQNPPSSAFEQIQDDKEDLARMIAQLELENKEMELQIERTKSQNNLLRNDFAAKPSEDYLDPEAEPQYKRFIKPSAALQVPMTSVAKKKSSFRGRPMVDAADNQMAQIMSLLESEVNDHVVLNREANTYNDRSKETPAMSIAMLQARVNQLYASTPSCLPFKKEGFFDETGSDSSSTSSDDSSNNRSYTCDVTNNSDTFQVQPNRCPSEQDAGEWLIQQIAKGNDALPSGGAAAVAQCYDGENSSHSDSTWTFFTLKTNKTGSSRSNKTPNHYMPKWTAPIEDQTAIFREDILEYQENEAADLSSPDRMDDVPYLSTRRWNINAKGVKSDPPETGVSCDIYSQSSTLESSSTPDPPPDKNHSTFTRVEQVIPEEDFAEPETTLPKVISFSSVENVEDDCVSAMSAHGRKVDRSSKSLVSTYPEFMTTHMDHEGHSLADSDSSSEVSEIQLILNGIEDKDKLLTKLQNSANLEYLDDSLSHTSSSTQDCTQRRNRTKKKNKGDKDTKSKKGKKLAKNKELVERSKLSTKRKTGDSTIDTSRHEIAKPLSERSIDTKKSKSSSKRTQMNRERTKSYSPSPPENFDDDVKCGARGRSQDSYVDLKISRNDDERLQVNARSKSKERKLKNLGESRSRSKSKDREMAKHILQKADETPKSLTRSKSKDRGMEKLKLENAGLSSKLRSRSKSKDRGIGKLASSRSLESEGLDKGGTKNSRMNRAKSHSPPPAKMKKSTNGEPRSRSRSKSKDRGRQKNDVSDEEKAVRRTLKQVKSLDKIDRAAKAAKVLERARSGWQDVSRKRNVKQGSSEDTSSSRSRTRSSSKEGRRSRSSDSLRMKETRRSKSRDISSNCRHSATSIDRGSIKLKKKTTRKGTKDGLEAQSALQRPKSTDNIVRKQRSTRHASLSPSRSFQNAVFVDVPEENRVDELAAFSLAGERASAMSRYFEKSRKKDYLSYTIH